MPASGRHLYLSRLSPSGHFTCYRQTTDIVLDIPGKRLYSVARLRPFLIASEIVETASPGWRFSMPLSLQKVRTCAFLFVLSAMAMLCTVQLHAQVSGATLSGTVRDSSGAVIPSAAVAITDVATGVTRNVTTDSAGFYTAPNLLPGNYEVSVTSTGFSKEVRTGITLTVERSNDWI